MTYKTIFGRSFSTRYEQKKLGCGGASICCFVMTFTLCTFFKSYLGPLPISNIDAKSTMKPIVSNFSNSRSDMFEMKGDIRIHGNSSTIFIASSQQEKHIMISWTIKPYPRKQDKVAMGKVREFKIFINEGSIPHCTQYFNTSAVLFSGGGYIGNLYHDFTDFLIPLYLTSRQFNTMPLLFLITDNKSWWTSKYNLVFKKFSKYDLIDIDNDNEVLCFSRVIVGLTSHKELSVDPQQSPYCSPTDFTRFLRGTYSLKRELFVNGFDKRPRLLIISREKTRRLMNEAQIADMGRNMGFDVVVREMDWNVLKVAQFVNSFDVMMGVHGAGLTNMVFLPERAVLIQIIPFGLDLLAKSFYQLPANDMELRYLEYNVSLNESSLLGKYPVHSEFYRDPVGVQNKGWHGFRSVYMDNQDVNLDLTKFRETLLKALKLLSS